MGCSVDVWAIGDPNVVNGIVAIGVQGTQGDKAVTRFTICGVQAREFTGIPATGKSAAVTAIGGQRIVEGRLNCMMQE